MPSPSLLVRRSSGLDVGGMRLSKLSLRLAPPVAGVLPATGVRVNAPCAGLGVTLTKSAKLKLVPGVLGPKPIQFDPFMPGVICDDGSGVDLHGGVEGGWMLVLPTPFIAGEGEVARWSSISAFSASPSFGVRDQATLCAFLIRRSGGGVCGGEEVMRVEELRLKLWRGRSASSSSLISGDGGSSAIVEPSEMKDSEVMLCEGKRACLVWLMGDDSGRPRLFFQDTFLPVRALSLLLVIAPDECILCRSSGLTLLLL